MWMWAMPWTHAFNFYFPYKKWREQVIIYHPTLTQSRILHCIDKKKTEKFKK